MILKFKKRKLIFFLLCLFVLNLPRIVQGHTVGYSLEKINAVYKIDIGYDSLDRVPPAEQAIRFDVRLYNNNDQSPVNYTKVLLSFQQNDETVFSATLVKPLFGPAGAVVTLPRVGAYALLVRYENETGVIVSEIFPFTVGPGEISGAQVSSAKMHAQNAAWVGLGILVGCLVAEMGLYIKKKKTA